MIALIPARGGSKGVPRKNIKLLGEMPLIAYTIRAALESKCISRVVVTTDDLEIADVAREYGAEVPFIRPDYLASDTAVAQDVYLHAVEYQKKQDNENIDSFMVLLPTAPFRTSKHICEAEMLFRKTNATTLVSVKEAEIPPSWYLSKSVDGKIQACNFGMDINLTNNRQFAQKYYVCNGAIYILNYELLKNKRTYFCDNTVPYIMNSSDSVDIDSISDFEFAEYLINKKRHVL